MSKIAKGVQILKKYPLSKKASFNIFGTCLFIGIFNTITIMNFIDMTTFVYLLYWSFSGLIPKTEGFVHSLYYIT